MSDTPRTDREIRDDGMGLVSHDFARKLEREVEYLKTIIRVYELMHTNEERREVMKKAKAGRAAWRGRR